MRPNQFTAHATYGNEPEEKPIMIEDKRLRELKKLMQDADNPLNCKVTNS